MNVLVGCEFSGTVRDAFRRAGHNAFSVDLEPDLSGSEFHTQGDVFDVLASRDWDLLIAHPPCTYLANSGVRWLHTQRGRWDKMRDGAAFFKRLLDCDVPRVCVENPVIHGYARELIGQHTQTIQPWQFGHGESKRICLWLRNLPPLVPTKVVQGREQRVWRLPPTPDRGKLRSIFFSGVGDAMAQQWGEL